MTTAVRPLPADAEERVARLFAEGQPLRTVLERAAAFGASRVLVEAVLSHRWWRLDASGRVPRELRPPVTPGKPLPRVGSGLAPSGFQPGSPILSATPDSGAPAGPVLPKQPLPVVPPPRLSRPVTPPPPNVREMDVDELLTACRGHRNVNLRQTAGKVDAILDDLRERLSRQLKADWEKAELERRTAADRERIAELEAELAKLRRKVAAAGKPARSTSTTAIEHGTWGGWQKERNQGLEHCEACDRAKDEHFTRMREKSPKGKAKDG